MGLLSVFRRPTPQTAPVDNAARDLHILGRQVQGAFIGQGLPVDLELRIQGARTVTVILAPIGFGLAEMAKVQRMEPVIQAALRVSPVRITQEHGRIFVEFPSPRPALIRGTCPEFRRAGLQVGLGLTTRNQVASIDLARDPHVLLVGPTRRGKSTAARSIIWHLIDQAAPSYDSLRVIVVGRPSDWSGLDSATNVWAVVPPTEALAVVRWLWKEVTHRERHGLSQPRIVLMMDDLLSQLVDESDLVAPLAGIASNGGAAGVHLVICSQRLGKRGVGDAAISGNILTRLVVGAADAQEASLFTGRENSGAERLTGDGDVLLVTRRGEERITVGLVTNEDLSALPRWRVPPLPWQPQREPVTPTTAPTVTTVYATPTTPTTPVATPTTALREVISPVVADETPPSPSNVAPVVQRLERREPTPDEYEYIRWAKSQLVSNEATCKALWGYKDGKSLGWLKLALGEGQ